MKRSLDYALCPYLTKRQKRYLKRRRAKLQRRKAKADLVKNGDCQPFYKEKY